MLEILYSGNAVTYSIWEGDRFISPIILHMFPACCKNIVFILSAGVNFYLHNINKLYEFDYLILILTLSGHTP